MNGSDRSSSGRPPMRRRGSGMATGLVIAGCVLGFCALSCGLAVLVGRGIRQADVKEGITDEAGDPLPLLGVLYPPEPPAVDKPVRVPGSRMPPERR